jgi:hypothetical protein
MPRPSGASLAFGTPTNRDLLTPPQDLNEAERAEFFDVVHGVGPNHFQPGDIPLIVSYVRAVRGERRAAIELDLAPVVMGKPSAWLAIWLGQLRAVTTLARRLRLGPAGRDATKATAEAPEPVSAYARIAMEAERDGRN